MPGFGPVASFPVDSLPAATSGTVSLVGVQATAAAGSLSAQSNAVQIVLIGVSSTGAVGSLAASVSRNASLTGVSATGLVGIFGVTASSNFSLVGVSATGFAGIITPTLDFLTVPMITIMNDNPVPVSGTMVADDVPMQADLPYQIAFEAVLNTNPIPMSGTMTAVPVPGEGSVP